MLFLNETFISTLKVGVILQPGNSSTCLTDHMPLISRAINKLLGNHSMQLFNCSFITFNELLFFWQSERFCCLCIRVYMAVLYKTTLQCSMIAV